jgi:hypothetical protein
MTVDDGDLPFQIQLTRVELELVRVALRHLLASEDDPETIEDLKVLLARIGSQLEGDAD